MKARIIILAIATILLYWNLSYSAECHQEGDLMVCPPSAYITLKTACLVMCTFPGFKLNEKTCECEKVFGKCPFCGSEGNKLGWIAIGIGDQWFANVAWIPSMDLYACPKCHLLFYEEVKNKKEE